MLYDVLILITVFSSRQISETDFSVFFFSTVCNVETQWEIQHVQATATRNGKFVTLQVFYNEN